LRPEEAREHGLSGISHIRFTESLLQTLSLTIP
jgi:hypothetical protein